MKKIAVSILILLLSASVLAPAKITFAAESTLADPSGYVEVQEETLAEEVAAETAAPVEEQTAQEAAEEDIQNTAVPSLEEDAAQETTEESAEAIEEETAIKEGEPFTDTEEETVDKEETTVSEEETTTPEEETTAPEEETTAPEEETDPADKEDEIRLEEEETVLAAAPSIKSCKSTDNGIKLTWGSVKHAASYDIYYKDISTGIYKKLANTKACSYTFTKAVSGKIYYFTVTAKASNTASDIELEELETSLNASKGVYGVFFKSIKPNVKSVRGKVYLSWQAAANAKAYLIYRRLPGKSWTKYAKTNSLSYVDANAKAATSYEYGVRAFTTYSGHSYLGSFVNANVQSIRIPSTVAVSKAASASQGIKVTWPAASGAATYKVYRKGNGKSWAAVGSTSSTSYTDKKAEDGVKYLYKVSACDKSGNEGACGSYKYAYALAGTKVTTLANNGSTVVLRWSESKKADGYRIYRRIAGESSWTTVTDVTGSLMFKEALGGYGKKYEYKVRPYLTISKKQYFGYADSNSIGTIVRLQTPNILVENYETDKGFNISWTSIVGATRYILYRYDTGSGWKVLKSLKTSYFIDRTVAKGVNYKYRVVACKGIYTSHAKTSKSVTLPSSIDLPAQRYLDLGWDVDPRRTGGPAVYDSHATAVNKKYWKNHDTIYGSNYKPHAGDIIVYGQEDGNGRVYQHVDICVTDYDASTGRFGVISGNYGSYFMTSPITYVSKSWVDFTSDKSAYNTIHNIWQCNLPETKKAALINSAYHMLEEYNKNPDYVRGKILDAMWIGPTNWCDVFVAYTIFIAQ